MKFVTFETPAKATGKVEVGNVYRLRGGWARKNDGPRYMVVVATEDRTAYGLTFIRTGQIVGTQRYAFHYLEDKIKVGFVPAMKELDLKVDWDIHNPQV